MRKNNLLLGDIYCKAVSIMEIYKIYIERFILNKMQLEEIYLYCTRLFMQFN